MTEEQNTAPEPASPRRILRPRHPGPVSQIPESQTPDPQIQDSPTDPALDASSAAAPPPRRSKKPPNRLALLRQRGHCLQRSARSAARPHPHAGHRHLRHPHRADHRAVPCLCREPQADRHGRRRRVHLHRRRCSSTSRARCCCRACPPKLAKARAKTPAASLSSVCSSTSASRTPRRCCTQKQQIENATWSNPGIREFRDAEGTEPEIAADTIDLVRVFRKYWKGPRIVLSSS